MGVLLVCSILLLTLTGFARTALAQPGFIVRTLITAYSPGEYGRDSAVRSYADYNSPLDINLLYSNPGLETVPEAIESQPFSNSPALPGIQELTSSPLGLFFTGGLGSQLLTGDDEDSRTGISIKPAFMLGNTKYDPAVKGRHSHLQLEDVENVPEADFNFGKFFATLSNKF